MDFRAAHDVSSNSQASQGSSFLGLAFRHGKPKLRVNDDDEDKKGSLGLNMIYGPLNPIVDFVFVHGLGGGSRETWSSSRDFSHFWPSWLSQDPTFQDVRVHSFGYNSDWISMKPNISNISDFALALLNALTYADSIRLPQRTPIVFIVHSMGGLVVKKACLLAWNDPAFEDLVPRFCSIVFLATPHRGSGGAMVAKNISRLFFPRAPRQYVEELERGSDTLQEINDNFRHIAEKLELYSFFETIKMNFVFGSVGNVMIVDKSSATLDYPHEQRFPIQANHRNICKFKHRMDPKYLLVKSVLASIVRTRGEASEYCKQQTFGASEILMWWTGVLAKLQERKAELKTIQGFLAAPDKPEDDLASFRDARANTQACSWIESKSYFSAWRDDLNSPQILWLRARPAFGKSVLSGYVVDHLIAAGHDCSYFFFKHRHPQKSTLSGMFRSIAYQMATAPGNLHIRDSLLSLHQDDVHFDHDDAQAIWRKVFLGSIFPSTMQIPQYWIIDGVDECDYGTSIFPLLAKMENIPLVRVMITSQESNELSRSSSQLTARLMKEEISIHDTRLDIHNYVKEQVAQLDIEDEHTRQYVTETIMDKACGCFLWVKLVLKELRDAHLRSSIGRILEEIPKGMDALYSRTLELMSKQTLTSSKSLVQAILAWVMSAVRPLTFAELSSALAIDVGEEIYRLRPALDSMCSQLVFIDAKDVVHPVHETAREYLLGNSTSEWAIPRAKGSTRLLECCLKYLTGQEMAVPRNRRTVSSHNSRQGKSPFASYASTAFSDHLRTATASSDDILILLAKFLQTNVLSWIDLVVREHKSVQHLIVAARNLKLFLDRRTKYKSPLGTEFSTTDAWSIDLERIATKFGQSLLSSPNAIYSFVPLICPSQSAIRKQFGREARGIEIFGNDLAIWDDRISCIIHRAKTPSAIACGDDLFAVGFSDPAGLIWTYGISTCQEKTSMSHPGSIKALAFSSTGDLLVSSGSGHLRIWNAQEGACLFAFETRHEPISIVFAKDDTLLMAASKGNHTCSWDLRNGCNERETCSWYDADGCEISQNVPSVVAFNHERTLLAAVYRGFPISLWETEDHSFLGYVHRGPAQVDAFTSPRGVEKKAAHPHVEAMVFNARTDQLVASYADGELCCFDSWSQELELNENVYVQTMACSPDGRTLAGGDSRGTIQLREFRTLRLLYKIVAFDDPISSLTFTANSRRLLDIRGSTCNVWEPSVLVRSEQSDDESTSDTVERGPVIVESDDAEDVNLLTALITGPGSLIFVGREEGNVANIDSLKGTTIPAMDLFRHVTGAPVSNLSWCESAATLATADLSSLLILTRISAVAGDAKSTCQKLFEQRLSNQAIRSVMLSPMGNRLLVVTSNMIYLYTSSGDVVDSITNIDDTNIWLSDPADQDYLFCLSPSSLRIFDWLTFRRKASMAFLNRTTTDIFGPNPVIKRIAVVPKSQKIVLRLSTITPKLKSVSLRVLELRDLSNILTVASSPIDGPCQDVAQAVTKSHRPAKSTLEPTHDHIHSIEDEGVRLPSKRLGDELEPLSKHLEMIIGTVPSTSEVAFLNKTMWVCTIDVDRFSKEPCYTRYFFIPHEWVTNNEDMMIRVTAQKDIVLAKRDKLIVFKWGLRNGEKVPLEVEH
ncbi:hypothetical protein MMC21_000643 [Puttea exsequens]|nr:hypothetical protein [Puttea exsequens]